MARVETTDTALEEKGGGSALDRVESGDAHKNRINTATGTTSKKAQIELISHVLGAMGMLKSLSDAEKLEKYRFAMAMLEGIAPTDELEGMLAAQMVATHSAAMECFRRAALPNQPQQARAFNLQQAKSLLSIYTRQVEVIDKRRGRGQQKVTVEYVNVEAGGQAVVGHVNTGSGPASPASEKTEAGTLNHRRRGLSPLPNQGRPKTVQAGIQARERKRSRTA